VTVRQSAAAALVATLLPALAPPAHGQGGIPERPELLRLPTFRFAIPAAPEHHALPNGLVVLVDEDHALPLVQVTLAVAAGDHDDPSDRLGLAGLTAAMLRRGGAGAWDAGAFDARADQLAAELDSLGGQRRSGATLDSGSALLAETLPLLAAMVRAPRFAAERLELLRGNLRESLSRREDDPLAVLDREWGVLMLGPRHFTTREMRPEHLAAIQQEDLAAFHRAHWRPDGVVIAVSGDVRTREVVAALHRLLGDWQAGVANAAPAAPPPLAPAPAAGLYLRDFATPQAKVALGHRGPQRRGWDDPDEAPLAVLAEVLGGGGAVSRLRRRLRAEEGLVYRASSSIGLGSGQPGTLRLFLETDNRNAARALQLARAELLRLRDEPVPEVELGLAKRSILDLFPLLFESSEQRAGRFAEDLLLGRPHGYWESYRRRVEAVTAADVQAAARRHLRPEDLVAVVVGDRAQLLAGAAAAGIRLERLLGPLQPLPPRDPLTLLPR
jgi:zinc protease